MTKDPELQQLAKLAFIFYTTTFERVDAELPNLTTDDIERSLSPEQAGRVEKLTKQIEETMPGGWIPMITEETIDRVPQEFLLLSEIMTDALRRNVSDEFLKASIPQETPPDTGRKFLTRQAPNLSAVFTI